VALEKSVKEQLNKLHDLETQYSKDCEEARTVMKYRNRELTRQWCEENQITSLKGLQSAAKEKGVSLGEMGACQFWAQGLALLNPISLLFGK